MDDLHRAPPHCGGLNWYGEWPQSCVPYIPPAKPANISYANQDAKDECNRICTTKASRNRTTVYAGGNLSLGNCIEIVPS